MKVKKVKYVGPTGIDPNLGHVTTDAEINIPVEFFSKYLDMKRIEEIKKEEKKEEKPAKFKRNKEDK